MVGGLFHVLYGGAGGAVTPAPAAGAAAASGFAEPKVLHGTDGQPLLIAGPDADDRICTRPFAVDLDGDGDLDLVAGNMRGTFAFFEGSGNGRFAPASSLLQGKDGPLNAGGHGDPCFADHDGDGDLDLFCGTALGGVFLIANKGNAKKPKFDQPVQITAPLGLIDTTNVRFGDAHLRGPQHGTRVWADDIDGNGKVDLLVGDLVFLTHLQKGVAEAKAKKALRELETKSLLIRQEQQRNGVPVTDKGYQAKLEALDREREKLVRDERTGFVWLYLRK